MSNVSLWTTVITAFGVLAGVLVTQLSAARQEERKRTAETFDRRTQAYAELAGSVRQLRTQLEVVAKRYWRDMDVQVGVVLELSRNVGAHASMAAVLSSGAVSEAARALAAEAERVTVGMAREATLGHVPGGVGGEGGYVGGEFGAVPDLSELERRLEEFHTAVSSDEAYLPVPINSRPGRRWPRRRG
ncbi:hypothetical protein [Spirillospora sp. CA-294931]|uniref:hypothetical protein n=1 Tax=Spirillospora sp. CA-294931 TaxID=3240042 RepID=UPI003D91199F